MDKLSKIKEYGTIVTDEISTLIDRLFRFSAKTKFDSLIEKKYQTLYNNTKLERENYENAFAHAYVSAHLAYYLGDKISLNLGYEREILTGIIERFKFGSKENAFLDTNRDLWNNKMGIEYAKRLKAQGKNLDEIAEEIFKNIMQEDSDFIVDYKNDKRRWKNATKEDIWKKAREELINIKKINSNFPLKSINSNPFLQTEKNIQETLKDFPIKDEYLNYKLPDLNFKLPEADLTLPPSASNLPKTNFKQQAINNALKSFNSKKQSTPNPDAFKLSLEDLEEATNYTLDNIIPIPPKVEVQSTYDPITNSTVNDVNIDIDISKIKTEEDMKKFMDYYQNLTKRLQQCVLNKVEKRA